MVTSSTVYTGQLPWISRKIKHMRRTFMHMFSLELCLIFIIVTERVR